jgi:hypothetical protein
MNSSGVFYNIGLYTELFVSSIYDNIGNIFNYSCIVLGFIGLFYWLNFQHKDTQRAKKDPNKII